MPKTDSDPLRSHLLELLGKGGAHADFATAVAGLKSTQYDQRIALVPHSPWDLLEHLRIAQADILAFTRDTRHKSPTWPDQYWPDKSVPPTPALWSASVSAFNDDRAAFVAIVQDPTTDLLAPLPHGDGQTVAREAMLLADHTAYHLGQLIIVRRGLNAWKD